jgi:hypothetical protein
VSLKFTFWRGALVLVAWIVWPPLWTVIVYALDFVTSTSRKCSIEGCDLSAGWIATDIVGTFVLPLVATLLWIRWRRLQQAG